MYVVVNPDDGTFVGTIEAVNAIQAVRKLWDQYGHMTSYKLYREVGTYAYEVAEEDFHTTNTNAKAASRT